MSRKVFIFDTTLRDGEQSPGASLTDKEKFEVAKRLVRLNVDIIEAGFPISSDDDFRAVAKIAEEIEGPTICALARALEADIQAAAQALAQAVKPPMIHTFIGTSKIHMEGQLRKNADAVLAMAVGAVNFAKSFYPDVEFSPMDATRTDPVFLREIVEAAIEAGATVINIPDTVGSALPGQMAQIILDLLKTVNNIDQARLSVHCHDDLGMATANALAAVGAGVTQIECAINGMGERAGNTALEEVVKAIEVQDSLDAYTTIRQAELLSISQFVSRLTGFPVPPNKAIVGSNVPRHSSGIHQDGVLKDRRTYELFDPASVGHQKDSESIPLSSRSGRHALQHRFSELGYTLSGEELERAYQRFLEVAEAKKEVLDGDLVVIAEEVLPGVSEKWALDCVKYEGEAGSHSQAIVWLKDAAERLYRDSDYGDGPVDATYKAIDKITGVEVELVEYSLQAITRGRDAMGEVMVKVKDNGHIIIGRGASTDIIEASAKAYINAINRLLSLREKGGENATQTTS